MNDHKPECVLSEPCSADEPHGFCGNSDSNWCMYCEETCDCARINRAEQRTLDAAREAVSAVNWFNDEGKMLSAVVATADSIAAIDALRESK